MNEEATQDTAQEGSTPEAGSTPTPETSEANAPFDMKRITAATDFIRDVEGEEEKEQEAYPTSRGEIGIRVIGGDELAEIFTAQYRDAEDGGEFDKLKTTEKIFVLTIAFGVANENKEPLFTASQVRKMYSGKNKSRYTEFLQECWDGVLSVNYWLEPKNPNSLRRMIRMLFG